MRPSRRSVLCGEGLCGAGAPARELQVENRKVRDRKRDNVGDRDQEIPHREGRASAPEVFAQLRSARTGEDALPSAVAADAKLTSSTHSDRILEFSREISAWLGAAPVFGRRRSGVSARGGGRAENLLLDLVRTGIENDFEKVVFPQYPALHEVKSVLERTGARYASLSGSGSAVYGLFDSREKAVAAAKKLNQRGTRAVVTRTLTRRQYWKQLLASSVQKPGIARG
jgi:hypothetical protein